MTLLSFSSDAGTSKVQQTTVWLGHWCTFAMRTASGVQQASVVPASPRQASPRGLDHRTKQLVQMSGIYIDPIPVLWNCKVGADLYVQSFVDQFCRSLCIALT